MRFQSLSDANDAFDMLEAEQKIMLGMLSGITTILTSLIAKHPGYDQFQLHLTSMVELADNGALGKALSPNQREVARAYVESLQQIKAVTGEVQPLG